MRILSRYFVARYLVLYAAVLSVALLALSVVEMLLHFDSVFESSAGAGNAPSNLWIRVSATYLRELLPFCSFAAAFVAVASPARRREVLAMKSGGLAPARSFVPLMIAAVVLSAGALVVNETLVMDASRKLTVQGDAADDLALRGGPFWYHRGGAIYNIRAADPDARLLRGVTVLETDLRGRLELRVDIPRVAITPSGDWHFDDAVARRFDPDSPEKPPTILAAEETEAILLGHREQPTLRSDASLLSWMDLRRAIDARASAGDSPARLLAALAARCADALAVAAFALLALPLALRAERRGELAGPALVGAAIIAAYYAARVALSALSGSADSAVPPWAPVGAAAGLAALAAIALARAPR